MDTLMIVESPSKANKIGKWLAKDGITVMPTIGHLRELDISKKKEEVVDVKNGYKMLFRNTSKNLDNTKKLLNKAKFANTIILASDPDFEGEAISWHFVDLLRENNLLDNKVLKRVTYTEITEKAIREAIANSRDLDLNKVEAQKCRQSLDYLLGFYLSPVLWEKITHGLSAGRVQSPALRILVQREKEIKAFVPKKYFEFTINTNKDNTSFIAKLFNIDGTKIEPQSIDDENVANEIYKDLLSLKDNTKLKVISIKSKQVTTRPKAPYTTSTLQQDAVNRIGFSSKRTMASAQKLYEEGYITYHRTDSTMLSEEALKEILDFGRTKYPNDILSTPIRYSTKQKNAQEAHEAIRPVYINKLPSDLKDTLGEDEYKLYNLIWQRTMACQMKSSISESTRVEMEYNKYLFVSNGSVPIYYGYKEVYKDIKEIDSKEDENNRLPKLNENDLLPVDNINKLDKETKPPARFNEATLVKALEEYGIGRPSTYATIPSTLKERGYITIEQHRITVTDVGLVVSDYLENNFPVQVDYQFTAKMEDSLDIIATGEKNRVSVLDEFFTQLTNDLDRVGKLDGTKKGVLEETNEPCPKCNIGTLNIVIGKYGKFKACSRGKDKCDYRMSLSKSETEYVKDKSCPKCGSLLAYRTSRKGIRFISCTNFSNGCRYSADENGVEYNPNANVTETICPKCKKYNLRKMTSRFGTSFYGCTGFKEKKCSFSCNEKDYIDYAENNVLSETMKQKIEGTYKPNNKFTKSKQFKKSIRRDSLDSKAKEKIDSILP